jgi:hypothetical protein
LDDPNIKGSLNEQDLDTATKTVKQLVLSKYPDTIAHNIMANPATKDMTAFQLDAIARSVTALSLKGTSMANEPGFADAVSARVIAERTNQLKIKQQDEFIDKQTVYNAMNTVTDGKQPVTIADISKDPKVAAAIARLQPTEQTQLIRDMSERASHGPYIWDEKNTALYNQIRGTAENPNASPADLEKIRTLFIPDLKMPAEGIHTLLQLQDKIQKGFEANPETSHAMQVLEPILPPEMKKKDPNGENSPDYLGFVGKLHDILQKEINRTGQPIKDQDILLIGNRMLQQQVNTPGTLWGTNKTPLYKAQPMSDFKESFIRNYKDINKVNPSDAEISDEYGAAIYEKFFGPATKAPK